MYSYPWVFGTLKITWWASGDTILMLWMRELRPNEWSDLSHITQLAMTHTSNPRSLSKNPFSIPQFWNSLPARKWCLHFIFLDYWWICYTAEIKGLLKWRQSISAHSPQSLSLISQSLKEIMINWRTSESPSSQCCSFCQRTGMSRAPTFQAPDQQFRGCIWTHSSQK